MGTNHFVTRTRTYHSRSGGGTRQLALSITFQPLAACPPSNLRSLCNKMNVILVGGLLIPLQELLQLCGVGYPCVLTLVQSWLFLPVWGAPFALRSLRVLIATSNGERKEKERESHGSGLFFTEVVFQESSVCPL